MEMERRLLRVAALLALSLASCTALRSCTRNGQAVVPCEEELLLDRSDRFLLTLSGHPCYAIQISSANPLDIYFYNADEWIKLRTTKREGPSRIDSRDTAMVLNWQQEMKICSSALDCSVTRANGSAQALYDLVIARSSIKNTQQSSEDTRVYLRVGTCASLSKWFYISLAATALGGFFTMLFLMCIISEYLLELHVVSKLLRRVNAWRRRRQYFVELAQMDRADQHHRAETKPYSVSFALSATGDINDYSDNEGEAYDEQGERDAILVVKDATEVAAVPHAF